MGLRCRLKVSTVWQDLTSDGSEFQDLSQTFNRTTESSMVNCSTETPQLEKCSFGKCCLRPWSLNPWPLKCHQCHADLEIGNCNKFQQTTSTRAEDNWETAYMTTWLCCLTIWPQILISSLLSALHWSCTFVEILTNGMYDVAPTNFQRMIMHRETDSPKTECLQHILAVVEPRKWWTSPSVCCAVQSPVASHSHRQVKAVYLLSALRDHLHL